MPSNVKENLHLNTLTLKLNYKSKLLLSICIYASISVSKSLSSLVIVQNSDTLLSFQSSTYMHTKPIISTLLPLSAFFALSLSNSSLEIPALAISLHLLQLFLLLVFSVSLASSSSFSFVLWPVNLSERKVSASSHLVRCFEVFVY